MKILLLLILLLPGFNEDVEKIAISRPAQSRNNIKVGNYLESELKKIGLQVERQRFSSGTNIIGTLRGKKSDTIIIDMVGHLRIKSFVPSNTVFPGIFKKFPWAKQISFRQGAGPSDHAPFQRKGIPFVWIFTGTHNRYHRPSDTSNSLNYKGMEKIKEYAEALIIGIDGGKQVIDYNNLWTLEYKH